MYNVGKFLLCKLAVKVRALEKNAQGDNQQFSDLSSMFEGRNRSSPQPGGTTKASVGASSQPPLTSPSQPVGALPASGPTSAVQPQALPGAQPSFARAVPGSQPVSTTFSPPNPSAGLDLLEGQPSTNPEEHKPGRAATRTPEESRPPDFPTATPYKANSEPSGFLGRATALARSTARFGQRTLPYAAPLTQSLYYRSQFQQQAFPDPNALAQSDFPRLYQGFVLPSFPGAAVSGRQQAAPAQSQLADRALFAPSWTVLQGSGTTPGLFQYLDPRHPAYRNQDPRFLMAVMTGRQPDGNFQRPFPHAVNINFGPGYALNNAEKALLPRLSPQFVERIRSDPRLGTAFHNVGNYDDVISRALATDLDNFVFLPDNATLDQVKAYLAAGGNASSESAYQRNLHGQFALHLARNPHLAVNYAVQSSYLNRVVYPSVDASSSFVASISDIGRQNPAALYSLARMTPPSQGSDPTSLSEAAYRASVNLLLDNYPPEVLRQLPPHHVQALQQAKQQFLRTMHSSGWKYRHRGQLIDVSSLNPNSAEFRYLAAQVLLASFASSNYASRAVLQAVGDEAKVRDYLAYYYLPESTPEQKAAKQKFAQERAFNPQDAQAAGLLFETVRRRAMYHALSPMLSPEDNANLSWISARVADHEVRPEFARNFQETVLDAFGGPPNREVARSVANLGLYGLLARTPLLGMGVDAVDYFGGNPFSENFGVVRPTQESAATFLRSYSDPDAYKHNLALDFLRGLGVNVDPYLDKDQYPVLSWLVRNPVDYAANVITATSMPFTYFGGGLAASRELSENIERQKRLGAASLNQASGQRSIQAQDILQAFRDPNQQNQNVVLNTYDPGSGKNVSVRYPVTYGQVKAIRDEIFQGFSQLPAGPNISERYYVEEVGRDRGVDAKVDQYLDSVYQNYRQAWLDFARRDPQTAFSNPNYAFRVRLLADQRQNAFQDLSRTLQRVNAAIPLFESLFPVSATPIQIDPTIREKFFDIVQDPQTGDYRLNPVSQDFSWLDALAPAGIMRSIDRVARGTPANLSEGDQRALQGVLQTAASNVLDVAHKAYETNRPAEAFARYAYADGWRRQLHKDLYWQHRRLSGILQLAEAEAQNAGLNVNNQYYSDYQALKAAAGLPLNSPPDPRFVEFLRQLLGETRSALLQMEKIRERSISLREGFRKYQLLQQYAQSPQGRTLPSSVFPVPFRGSSTTAEAYRLDVPVTPSKRYLQSGLDPRPLSE